MNTPNLFYYTVTVKEEHEDEMTIDVVNGASFNLDDVLMTARPKNRPEHLEVVLKHNFEEIVPLDYKMEVFVNPVTKRREQRPVKATKFEVVSQPLTVILTDKADIDRFFKLTNAPFVTNTPAF
jgi:hypothetical protein